MADLLGAFESEEFALRVLSLNDAVGKESEAIARLELDVDLFVLDAVKDAEWERRRQVHFAAVAVRAEVSGVGDGHLAVGVDAGAEAGCKAGDAVDVRSGGRSEHDLVEVCQNSGWIVGGLVAQSANEGAGVHSGLEAFAADVSYDDEHGLVFQWQCLEEVSTNAIGWQVGALEDEVFI